MRTATLATAALAALFVFWDLVPEGVGDVLEFQPVFGGEWQEVPRPYNIDGTHWKVDVTDFGPGYYRVRRDWIFPL